MIQAPFPGDDRRIPQDARLECRICWHVYDPAEGDPVWQAGHLGWAMQVPWETVPAQSSPPVGATLATASGARRHIPGRRGTWPSTANWAA